MQRLLGVAEAVFRHREWFVDAACGVVRRPQRAAEPVSGPNPDNLVDLTGQSDDEEVTYIHDTMPVLRDCSRSFCILSRASSISFHAVSCGMLV